VVTFKPSVPLSPYSTYWIYIGTGIKSASGNPLLSGYWGGSFSTAGTADTSAPKVTRTNPADGITGVPVNSIVSIEFNEPMEPSTLNSGNVTISSADGANLNGRISVGSGIYGYNTVATFIPDQLLPADTSLTITVAANVKDSAGNILNQAFTSTFTTQSGFDNFRPWITAVSPFYNQGGVPLNTRVELTFSERMNPLTINGNTFWLQGPEGRVPGNITVSPDGLKATLTLSKPLLPNSGYSIRYSSGMTDVAGNASLSDGWHYFYTGVTISDSTPLSIASMTPENGAKGVALNALITIKFNKPLAATSVNKDTVIVAAGGVPVEGSISLDDNNTRIRFRPANLILFNPNTFYEVTVTTGVTDVAGNTLAAPYVGGFTTGGSSDTTAPSLVSYTPTYNASNVPVDTAITLAFNEPLNPTSLNWWSSIRLTGDGIYGNVPTDINLSTDRKTVTVKPYQPLFSWKRYYVSINGIEDNSGNTYNGGWFYFNTAAATGTDGNSLPTGATVWSNPDSLFADGETTTTVIISNINRNGVLVPNGTKVAVTADTVFRQDSNGGTILGGIASASDPRLRIFTTLGGSITFTYKSINRSDLTPGATVRAYVQILSVDAAERGINMIGQGGITLFRGNRVDISLNPENLLANGTSTSDVRLVLYGNNNAPWPAGRRIAVTVDPVYRQDSAGGTINGGTPAIDSRFKIFTTISGGIVDFTYTAPVLQAGQSKTSFIQVAEIDDAGRIVGLLGYRQINLNGSSGYTAPQPVILTVSPSNGQWGVGLNAAVVASFSQPLEPATITGSNFYVNGPNGRVSGTLTLSSGFNGSNTVVTFKPSVPLSPYSTYWIYIGTGIKSASGNPLLSYWSGGFSTSGSADAAAPKVMRTNPADGITGVPVNSIISIEFNEPVEPSTLNPGTVTLSAGGVNLSGRIGVAYGNYGYNTLATFIPDQLLPSDTLLTVTVDGIKDASGNPLTQAFTSTFTTQSGFDNFRPWVTGVSPVNSAVDVPVNISISVSFSEAINPLTLNGNTFYINGPGGRVPGKIGLKTGNTEAVFTPSVPLFANSWYSVNVNGVTDIAGNGILSNLSSSFRTAFAATISPLPTGASLFINPDSLYANGKIYTTVMINNININGTPAPNGTVIAVTAQPAYNQGSVGGVISGNSIGTSADGRFLLFQTLGASVTLYYTPPDLTSMRPGSTAPAVIQVASVDADTRPVNLISQGTVTLFAISSASISASPSTLVANGANTAKVTVTIRDRNGNLVPDGTPVGLTVAPVFVQNTAGGSFVDGTSGANDQVQIYKTVAGQFTATYQTPASKGNGTAIVQAVTVDTSGNPAALINTANITLQ
jgi:methionine-rich copper-binding protein CopC